MTEDVVETNAANWKEEVLESKELVVIGFWHPQCPYCTMLEPVYAELSQEYAGKLKFAKFNVLERQPHCARDTGCINEQIYNLSVNEYCLCEKNYLKNY